MTNYIITQTPKGIVLTCEALDAKGQVVRTTPLGPFEVGARSLDSMRLALAIADHYFGASPSDPGATAEANRQAPRILDAFLLPVRLLPGATFELSGDVLNRFFDLPA